MRPTIIVKDTYMSQNNSVKAIREARLLSKAELARKAGVSALTIDRVERGEKCRLETMRKIIFALGYTLEEKDKVF